MNVQIAHGSRRRSFDIPSRWSGGGTSSATEPPRRDRFRLPMKSNSTMTSRNGTDDLRPLRLLRNLGRMSSL